MKHRNYGPCLGKLVHQLPRDITLAYDLHLMHTILDVVPIFLKKRRLGPQNGFGSSRSEKLLKIVNCATIKEIEKPKETMVGPQVE